MRKFFWICLAVILVASCAQIVTPDGGEPDRTPPKVVKYMPDSAATNFKGKKIILRFNEYVQLKDLSSQLIVSPPLRTPPKVSIRRKDVVIEFSDTLQENTTYSVSFGNAIRDITEGNAIDNFRYVFSTGPTIDSLSYAGKVVNAYTMAPEKGVLVMLYKETGDSVPYKKRPYYFTKTREDGSFLLTNLKAGKYKVFALDDKSQDYLYNSPEERIAFPDNDIELNANTDSVLLRLFQEKPSVQKRTRVAQPVSGHIAFVYSMALKNPGVEFRPALPGSVSVFIDKGVTGDSIDIWLSSIPYDSVRIIIRDENNLRDSVNLRLLKPEKARKTGRGSYADQRALTLTSNISGGQADPQKPLVVYSNNPIRALVPGGILLLKGKDTLKADYTLSENKRQLIFKNTFAADSSYQLFIRPKTLTDWFDQPNDTFRVRFDLRPLEDYGALKIVTTGLPAGNYLLRLVTTKDEPVREIPIEGSGTFEFAKLLPGEYRVKLITDENKNGRWDSGNYLQRRQPEKVIYYASAVKMRAGWDMDINWVFK
jgi:hypothetical protein